MPIDLIMTESTSDSETTLAPDDGQGVNRFTYCNRGGPLLEQMDAFGRHPMDIYRLPQYVKVNFEDIFREPSSLENGDIGQVLSTSLKRVLNFVYSYTHGAIYYFLTIVTGVPLCMAWGVLFGIINFSTVWFIHPMAKLSYIALRVISIPTSAIIRTTLDPVFVSMGQVFTSISARFKLRVEPSSGCHVEEVQKCVSDSYKLCNSKPRKRYHKGSFTYPPEWLGFV